MVDRVNIYAYWASTIVWDVISYLPTPLFLLAVVNGFDVSAYTEGDASSCFAALLFLFGPAVAAFTYLVSFLFNSHSTAQIVIMFLNFLTGLCLMIVSFGKNTFRYEFYLSFALCGDVDCLLHFFGELVLTTISSTSEINLSLKYMYLLFPSFCLGGMYP